MSATAPPPAIRRAPAAELAPLLRRLSAYGPLSEAEVTVIRALDQEALRDVMTREKIHAEGDSPAPAAILAGWGCRARFLPDGRRQIVGFLLPGDLIGRLPPCLPAPCTALAIGPMRMLEATPLLLAAAGHPARYPGLARAVRAIEQREELLSRDQIVRLGRQTAYERLCGLLVEFLDRLAAAGLAHDDSFAMPLTQDVLGDALGLSAVHVNRTLQQVRRDGLVDVQGKLVVIRDRAAMRELSGWQPPPQPTD